MVDEGNYSQEVKDDVDNIKELQMLKMSVKSAFYYLCNRYIKKVLKLYRWRIPRGSLGDLPYDDEYNYLFLSISMQWCNRWTSSSLHRLFLIVISRYCITGIINNFNSNKAKYSFTDNFQKLCLWVLPLWLLEIGLSCSQKRRSSDRNQL